ncbi:MAG: OmpA family protein [Flavobacteriales bacterium]|nr:OmpA family protein [Flavobacteriales bacterium]MCB9447439.1 OmpA family protein [Flavobacteriales bacterium]
MTRLSRILCAFILLFIVSLSASAQMNFMKEANDAYDAMKYFEAIDLYKKAYTKAKKPAQKAEILFKTAECYRMSNDTRQAEVWYDKALKAKYKDHVAQLYYADMKKANEKYDEAIVEYNAYKALEPDDIRGKEGVEACTNAQKWKDDPTRYKVENMALINSEYHDFSPSYAKKDYSLLYFTSTRPSSLGKGIDEWVGQSFSDIYETKRDKNGKWSQPTPIAGEVNGPANDGSSFLDDRGSSMVFTRCDVQKTGSTVCKLCSAKKKGTGWSDIEPLPFGNDTVQVGHPSLTDDESIIYFASDMAGGQGGKDIWMATYTKKSRTWSEPKNLGPTINTPGNEMYPFIHSDGTLYFASDGQPGMGGLDIFFAKPDGDDWKKPENMKYPINSAGDDFAIIVEKNAERGYFTSNRANGKGGDDIYMFWLPPLVFTLQGVAYDVESKGYLPSTKITIDGGNGESITLETDTVGHYFTQIKQNMTYDLTASKQKFLNDNGTETTMGLTESADLVHDFYLQSTATKEIRFPDVLYDLDKYELRPESKDSLDFLYKVLVNNPTIVIELSAHTDSRGSDKYNKTLSQKRAQSCVDYLVSKGIPSDRMVPVGYGESRLLVTDADIAKLSTEEEKEAAHQKNRRTVFSVIRDNYVPKASNDGKAPSGGAN